MSILEEKQSKQCIPYVYNLEKNCTFCNYTFSTSMLSIKRDFTVKMSHQLVKLDVDEISEPPISRSLSN